jgi:beta propeller repeat protein
MPRALASTPYTAFPISVATGPQYFAKTDGRYVVWTDVAYSGGPPGSTNDASGYDLSTGQHFTLANGPRYQDEVSISGGVALWSDWTPGSTTSGNIYGRDLANGGGTFTVTVAAGDQSAHAISGGLVVWHDNRNGHEQIWGRHLDQPLGSDFAISTTNVTYDQEFPDVSGSIAVWNSFQEPGDQGNIYGRDVDSGSLFPICKNPAFQYEPAISGSNVVWSDTRDGAAHVYGKDLGTGIEFRVSSGVSSQYEPAIDGDLVVWRDDRSGTSDIWGRYLSGGPEFQITDTPTIWEDYPDVSGNVVVWQQGSSDTDIYGTRLPEPSTFARAMIAGLALLRRRRPSRPLNSI